MTNFGPVSGSVHVHWRHLLTIVSLVYRAADDRVTLSKLEFFAFMGGFFFFFFFTVVSYVCRLLVWHLFKSRSAKCKLDFYC